MPELTLAELLWSQPRVQRRGPRPRVELTAIVAAAVRIADAEGLDAASMQRVADALGVTKMALYRHVPGRGELVALMIEAAVGSAPVPAGDWRAGLRCWADAMREGLTRHRWLAQATVGGRLVGPAELSWFEAGLAALDGLPLSAAQRLDTLALVSSHVRGMVQQQIAAHPERTIATLLAGALERRADEFPLAAVAFAQTEASGGTDNAYEFGLGCIIAGIDAMVGKAGRQ